jgi:tetratricopeptide (TPR) repeat protein
VVLAQRIFISYASEDRVQAQAISAHLRSVGLDPWRDSEQLTPGDDWEREILQALTESDAAIVCFSPTSLAKRGYVQKEWRLILETADRIPLDQNFIVPVRLAECTPPFRFRQLQRADIFPDLRSGLTAVLDGLRNLKRRMDGHRRPAISNVPGATRHFFGREDLLDRIHQELTGGEAVAVTTPTAALAGLGGIGKTQLAFRYAQDHAVDYAVRWYIESESAPARGLVALGAKLGLPEAQQALDDVILTAVHSWLQSNPGWLLIFDNAESQDVLKPFIPEGSGHVLITSRSPNWSYIATPIAIKKWTHEESVAYLLSRTGEQRSDARSLVPARAIAKEFDGLPLALEQASAYVLETGCGLAGYSKLLDLYAPDLLDDSAPPDHVAAAKAFGLTFDRIENDSPAVFELLIVLSVLAPEEICEFLIDSIIGQFPRATPLGSTQQNSKSRNDAFGTLIRHSLVSREARIVSTHRVTQMLCRKRASQRLQAALEACINGLYSQIPDQPNQTADWLPRIGLEPHVLSVLSHLEHSGGTASLATPLWFFCSDVARWRGDSDGALNAANSALENSVAVTSLAPQNLVFQQWHSQALNRLGDLYQLRGDKQNAETLFVKALLNMGRLPKIEREQPEILQTILYTHLKLAQVASALSQEQNSLRHALQIAEELSASDPSFRRELATCHSFLGNFI